MSFYVNRVSQVEAQQLTADNADALAQWCGGLKVEEHDIFDHDKVIAGINVPNTSGNERASEGDYIIRNEHGRFHVRSKENFEKTFEPA